MARGRRIPFGQSSLETAPIVGLWALRVLIAQPVTGLIQQRLIANHHCELQDAAIGCRQPNQFRQPADVLPKDGWNDLFDCMCFHGFMEHAHFGQNFLAIKVLSGAVDPAPQTNRLSESIA